jgi:hypothetical protein
MPISIITITPVSATVVTAGATPVSGTPSGFAGPWAVETQTLSITYCRVPTVMTLASGSDTQVLSLSGNNVRTTTIKKTGLNFIINATYSLVKDYNSYSTSGHQQPQTFTILADSDPFGNDYGTYVASSNKYNLGPAGTVVTVQPYTRRVAWDDNLHTITNKSVNAVSFLPYTFNGAVYTGVAPIQQVFSNFNLGIFAGEPHNYTGVNPGYLPINNALLTADNYPVFGGYSRAKESDARFAAWLDTVAHNVTVGRYWRTNITQGVDWSFNGTNIVEITPNTSWFASALAEYSGDRHQY